MVKLQLSTFMQVIGKMKGSEAKSHNPPDLAILSIFEGKPDKQLSQLQTTVNRSFTDEGFPTTTYERCYQLPKLLFWYEAKPHKCQLKPSVQLRLRICTILQIILKIRLKQPPACTLNKVICDHALISN